MPVPIALETVKSKTQRFTSQRLHHSSCSANKCIQSFSLQYSSGLTTFDSGRMSSKYPRGKDLCCERSDITPQGDGKFHVTERKGYKAVKTITVNLPEGSCECSQFQKSLIPCKHMFGIFSHFLSDWSWKNLPATLTESSHVTLDTAVLHSEEATEVFDDCDQGVMKDEMKFSDSSRSTS